MIVYLRFCGELIRAAFHLCREKYYALALRHIGDSHPDSWLLARRKVQSQMIVNDFLRRI